MAFSSNILPTEAAYYTLTNASLVNGRLSLQSNGTAEIKIDKTRPTGADFVISGTAGEADWYTSDVEISYKGEKDEVSEISSVTLSKTSITENTNGEEVTLITEEDLTNDDWIDGDMGLESVPEDDEDFWD